MTERQRLAIEGLASPELKARIRADEDETRRQQEVVLAVQEEKLRREERRAAIDGFFTGAFIVAFWVAVVGGSLYALVRFVKWAWEG